MKKAFMVGLIVGTGLFLLVMAYGEQRGGAKAATQLLDCEELGRIVAAGNPIVTLDMVEKYRRSSCSDPKTTYHCLQCLHEGQVVLRTLVVRYYGKPVLIDSQEHCECPDKR